MEIYGSNQKSRRFVSRSQIQRLKQGGVRATQIKKRAKIHHDTIDIPNAEKMLEENIDSAYTSSVHPHQKQNPRPTPSLHHYSFFSKIKNFILRLFYVPK